MIPKLIDDGLCNVGVLIDSRSANAHLKKNLVYLSFRVRYDEQFS